MYKLLSDAFHAAARLHASAGGESAEAVAERRERWVRDRQEREALAEFLMTSEAGQRIGAVLATLADTQQLEPTALGHGAQRRGSEGSRRTQEQRAASSALHSTGEASEEQLWSTQVEQIVFETLIGTISRARTRTLLRRAGARLPLQDASPVSHLVARQPSTTLKAGRVVPRSSTDSAGPTTEALGSGRDNMVQAPTVRGTQPVSRGSLVPEVPLVPVKLVSYLVERWRRAMLAKDPAPSDPARRTAQIREYLLGILPMYCGIIEAGSHTSKVHASCRSVMLRHGIEGAIRASLKELFPLVISSPLPSPRASLSTAEQVAAADRAQSMALFEVLVHLLRVLHLRGDAAHSTATGLSCTELILGTPAHVLKLTPAFPDLSTVRESHRTPAGSSLSSAASSGAAGDVVDWAALDEERCGLATDLAVTYLLPLAKGAAHANRAETATSFAAQTEAQPMEAEEDEEEETCLSNCVCDVFMSLLPIRVSASEIDVMSTTVVSAVSILLARYVSDQSVGSPPQSARLLHQVSCGFVLTTQLLRECPAVVVEAMNNAGFFDNTLNALLCLGVQYGSGEYGGEVGEASLRHLQALTSLGVLQSARRSTGASVWQPLMALPRPTLSRLAAADCADELLHSFLGLLAARRHVRQVHTVFSNPRLLGYLDQLELALVKVFLVVAAAPAANTGESETEAGTPLSPVPEEVSALRASAPVAAMLTAAQLHAHSCLFDALMRYAVDCLPASVPDVQPQQPQRAGAGSTPAPATPSAVTGTSNAVAGGGGARYSPDEETGSHFSRLVDSGLYRILLKETAFFPAFREDPRLLYATTYMLLQVLTGGAGSLPAAVSRTTTSRAAAGTTLHDSPASLTAGSGGPSATPGAPLILIGRGVDAEVEAILSSFFALSRRGSMLGEAVADVRKNRADTRSSHTFASTFLTANPRWRSTAAEKAPAGQSACSEREHHFRTGSDDNAFFVAVMLAVLAAAVAGPRRAQVRAAMVAENAFRLVGHAALKLAFTEGRSEQHKTTPLMCGATEGSEGGVPASAEEICSSPSSVAALAKAWALHVLSALLDDDSSVSSVFAQHTDVVLGLLLEPHVRPAAEKLLVILLCHHTSATATSPAQTVEYMKQMQPLATQLWAVLSQCDDLTGQADAVIARANPDDKETTTHSKSDAAETPQGRTFLNNASERDAVFLAVLQCVRVALARLSSGPLVFYISPARSLQHVLCDPQVAVTDAFVRLIHRASQPWASTPDGAMVGLEGILATIAALIRGNPALRSVLLRQTIGAAELVTSFHAEWLNAQTTQKLPPADALMRFARSILGVAYECDPAMLMKADGGDLTSVSTEETEGKCCPSIQNPELLAPLLACVAESLEDDDSAAGSLSGSAVLEQVLSQLLRTMRCCRASVFLLASSDLLETLAQLLPHVAKGASSGNDSSSGLARLRRVLVSVMKLSLANHVDVRQMKHLLMSIVHAAALEDRVVLASLVMEIVSSATAAAAWLSTGESSSSTRRLTRTSFASPENLAARQQTSYASHGVVTAASEGGQGRRGAALPEPPGYIAFRKGSGTAGVKAILQELSLEGYSVCLWLRIEPTAVEGYRTLFCLQSPDRKTALELRMKAGYHTLSVAYLDAQRMPASVDLDYALPFNTWVHLCLVHRPPNFLTGATSHKALAVYVNGALVATSSIVPYPAIARAYFYLGIPGEDYEQRSVAHALVGQLTALYLLGCSLGTKEARQFFLRECGVAGTSTTTLATGAANAREQRAGATVAAAVEGTVAALYKVGGIDAERQWIDKTILSIDPRLAETGNRLYNFSAVLKGRPRESTLTSGEGTMVCNTTNALDAVCVLGALPTVMMPFTVLLVNVHLPFSPRGFAPTPKSKGVVTTQKSDDAVHHLLELIDALTAVTAVRAEMADAGLFILLAAALEEVGPMLGMQVPEHLLNVCAAKLLSSPSLFETAYTSLFMSAELLRACPPGTQLIWLNAQKVAVSMDEQLRSAVRAAGAQMFLVTELLHTLKGRHDDRSRGQRNRHTEGMADTAITSVRPMGICAGAGDDFIVKDVAPQVFLTPPAQPTADPDQSNEEANAREHHARDMLDQLFSLLEVLTGTPVMMGDAVAIQVLVSSLFQVRHCIDEDDLGYVLRRVRLLVCARDALLCQHLGRRDYMADLLLFVRSTDFSRAVRLEALLQLLLLTSRSRRTQELMNPTLLANKSGTHAMKDISFSWLRNLLQPFVVDASVYMTLRSALVADYNVPRVPTEYAPLTSTDTLSIAPVASTILALMKRTDDTHLKSCALTDLLFLLKRDAQAWRKLLAIPGWYIQVVSLYTTEVQLQLHRRTTVATRRRSADDGTATTAAADDGMEDLGESCTGDTRRLSSEAEAAEAAKLVSDVIFSTCAAVLSITLYHALMNETYGATELEMAVAYMEAQGAGRLLNQVLSSIAERLHAKLATSQDASVTNFLGLGTNTALMNFTTFVYCVEDVLFYTQYTTTAAVATAGGARSAGVVSPPPPPFSPTSSGEASKGVPTGSVVAGAARGQPAVVGAVPTGAVTGTAAQGKPHGYTEWDQLKMDEGQGASNERTGEGLLEHPRLAQQPLSPLPRPHVRTGEWKLRLMISPDDHWVHLNLALKVADLLASNATLLNCGGTTLAGGAAETLFATGAQYRKGGFLRIFCRLVRVAASMTLRAALPLDALVLLLDRYVRMVDAAASIGFMILKKRATTLEEAKEHSSLVVTMTLLYVVHDLLIRRLRATETHGGTGRFAHINAELVDKLKCLFLLFKKPFEALPCFTNSHEGDGSNASERFVRRETTPHWLETRSFASTAATNSAVLEAFVEVASRADYNAFMERCMLSMERDQVTDKNIASDVAAERLRRFGRLRSIIASLSVGQQAVVEGLQRLVDGRAAVLGGGVGNGDVLATSNAASLKDASFSSSTSTSAAATISTTVQPRVAAAMMISTARAGVWARFLEAIKGTIWSVDPPGAKHLRKYVSLSAIEQQPLVRRKVLLSSEGTSHREVTEKARRGPPRHKHNSASSLPTEQTKEDDLPEHASRLRLRGGEAVLLEHGGIDEEDPLSGALPTTPPLVGVGNAVAGGDSDSRAPADSGPASRESSWADGAWPDESEIAALRQKPSPQSAASPLPQGATEEDSPSAADHVLLSIPCEVPHLMHCWSATFTIRGGDICVFFDEVNAAYNQKVADEAVLFLTRPQNFSFRASSIVQIAPARRFRMKRTGLEMWMRDRHSCFVNFHDPSTMRVALQKVCQVAVAHQRRGGQFGGLMAGRRFVSELAAGLMVIPRNGLLGPTSSLMAALPILSAAANNPLYVYQENPLKEPLRLQCMQQWQNRELSNFDYLMWLNLLSGRSVNDITQYPVFPWVLADYASESLDLQNPETFRDLTRPIGACGEASRRDMIQRRYEDMKALGDVPAHYFTHYSSPAVVIYYMVRLEPFSTLQLLLQGGHFDHPDRMFHSICAAYRAVTTSTQDTRELIPELYYLPEICTNGNAIHFGDKQDGEEMDHLQLPPWAHGSSHEFTYYMRAALESEHVSAQLHHWIDLIFGAKQRGKEAIEALNVFNWHSYEDLDRHRGDAVDQQLLIDSLDNIGQTPIQLFRRPHCARRQRTLASPLECGVSLKVVVPRLGPAQQQRIAFVSLDGLDKLILVGATSVSASFKITVQPLKRPVAGPATAASARDAGTVSPVTPSSVYPTPTVSHADPHALGIAEGAVSSTQGGASPAATAAAAPFALPPAAGPDPSVPPALTNTATVGSVTALPHLHTSGPGSPNGTAGGAHALHGGFETHSFDMSEEYDRKLAAVPPGVIPNPNAGTSGTATTPSFLDGPCTPHNTAVLCLGTEAYAVLGGMYDNSVVVRPLSGLAEEVRLLAHRGRVVRLAVSGDSRFLVTGAEDTTFVVWGCSPGTTRRSPLEVQLLFTVYGHEDNPTAAQVSSTLDLVATASRDGALMLHSLSTGSLDRTIRHPSGYSIDHLLIQSNCYVPNVLYASQTDSVVHQVSVNGTALRSFTPPGRLTSWATTPEQLLLLTCTPHNQAVGSGGTKAAAAAPADVGAFDIGAATTTAAKDGAALMPLPSSGVLYLHSFFLTVQRAVPLPSSVVVQTAAVHPQNAQVAVLGTKTGELLLLRSTVQQSMVL